MRNTILLYALALLVIGCNRTTPEELERLESKAAHLNTEISDSETYLDGMRAEQKKLGELVTELEICADGVEPVYILELEISQSRFSLDLMDHAKDALNAAKFELPVSKEFYERARPGASLMENFRLGSLVLNGTTSDWKIKVISKRIGDPRK